MNTCAKRYQTHLFSAILLFVGSSFFLSGCSKWNVEPKEIAAVSGLPTLEVTNVDVFAITGRGWTATFTYNLTSKPTSAVTALGVCYSTTNKTPSLVDASGATATAKATTLTLPGSFGFLVTTKATYYYRAYAQFADGRVSYSAAALFTVS